MYKIIFRIACDADIKNDREIRLIYILSKDFILQECANNAILSYNFNQKCNPRCVTICEWCNFVFVDIFFFEFIYFRSREYFINAYRVRARSVEIGHAPTVSNIGKSIGKDIKFRHEIIHRKRERLNELLLKSNSRRVWFTQQTVKDIKVGRNEPTNHFVCSVQTGKNMHGHEIKLVAVRFGKWLKNFYLVRQK